MRGLKRSPGLVGLGVLLVALMAYAGLAKADISSDQPGTLVIFPKIISDGTRDTAIQLANTSNSLVMAHCYYVNNAGACASSRAACEVDRDCPLTEPCVHVCRESDFTLYLTGQQPTVWLASTGRGPDPTNSDGFFFGKVPQLGRNFIGELKCVQVDRSGSPAAGNALKGEAIIFGQRPGMVSEYNALSVIAAPTVNATTTLQLGAPAGSPAQFNACPAKLIAPHWAEGVKDFTGATVNSELTLVACSELLEEQTSTYSSVNMVVYDEFERMVGSPHVDFNCSLNRRLSDINAQVYTALGSTVMKTSIRPQNGSQCYSGDNRCHICGVYNSDDPALADYDNTTCATGTCVQGKCSDGSLCGCVGKQPNEKVGNCNCTGDSQCLNYATVDGVPLGCRQSPGLLGVIESSYTGPNNTATEATNLYMVGSRPGDVIVQPQLNPPPTPQVP